MRDGARDTASTVTDPLAWPTCSLGQTRCQLGRFQRCVTDGEFTAVFTEDCAAAGLVCDATRGCLVCTAGTLRCTPDETTLERCAADGNAWATDSVCDLAHGLYCLGDRCRSPCDTADVEGSNMGCEYYSVDLDNAQIGVGESAASQQYAVVVSNPDPRRTARVVIERNTAPPGMPPVTDVVASAVIPPVDLESFPLPAREVDCSAPGTFNTGTGTCLSSQAYRITSTIPVIAFQFNPQANTGDFSNDASLLVPTNSVAGSYMVMGWPQTIASKPIESAFNPVTPFDLRGFLTVVGTRPGTHVRVTPRADVLPGGPLATRGLAGIPIEVTLGPFDVLNLETDWFRADLTGSLVTSDAPVVVFSGNECSDVPDWATIGERMCCCDHLEAQQFPRGTAGSSYVAVHTASRSEAAYAAGAPVGRVPDEPEFFRVLAVSSGVTHVRTTVPTIETDVTSPPLEFDLAEGEVRTIRALRHFEVRSDAPVSVANFMSSQMNTGIPLRYPGGDGSFVPIPPAEQWRSSYVFLVPTGYAFDFVMVVAPADTTVRLDGDTLPTIDCAVARGDGCVVTPRHPCPAVTPSVYTCQLSYPTIDPLLPYPQNVMQGRQRDGVHVVEASNPVGVIVSGFDLRVSYGYPAGTQLRPLF